ncbi:hypothetical protein B9Z55_010100 [Caenorhabditis nigoni]|nr:hypothetical protein B9Z55_010100 [Caenorhabditis nigoni]
MNRVTRYLTEAELRAVVAGWKNKVSRKDLAASFQISVFGINRILQRFKHNGEAMFVKKRPGRGSKTTQSENRSIVALSRDDPRKSASEIHKEFLEVGGPKVTVQLVRRRLRDVGLRAHRPVSKPLISAKNRYLRMKFAKEHKDWDIDQWKQVLWSDESKFMLFGSDGKSYVRRPLGTRYKPEYQVPTVKHGGGCVMVWGCFSGHGVGPLHRIEGIMDKHMYRGILDTIMLPHARKVHRRRYLFQHDNDPKHASIVVKEYIANKRIPVMKWPSQSPDLNPIEHFWEHCDRMLRDQRAKNAKEKFEQLQDVWSKIPQEVLDKLLESIPRRCQAVIEARGYATKY